MTYEILPKPTTVRVVQVSPKEIVTYDMPMETYEIFRDVYDWRRIDGYSKSQLTVKSILDFLTTFGQGIGWDVMKDITVTQEPAKKELRGLSADVWVDEFLFRDGEEKS